MHPFVVSLKDPLGKEGRCKTIWRTSERVKITHEAHPYHTRKHQDFHWHLDTPGRPHQTFQPGDPIPGF